MTISRRVAWDGSQLAANGGTPDVPDEALHNSAVVGSSNADPVGPVRPPLGGAGSGHDEWLAYAKALDLELPEDATRADIIAAVDRAES